jgi:hypothetical protein
MSACGFANDEGTTDPGLDTVVRRGPPLPGTPNQQNLNLCALRFLARALSLVLSVQQKESGFGQALQ